MTSAVYTLHVNDDVTVNGIPAVVQGRITRNGETKIMVAVMRKHFNLLPPDLQSRARGTWLMLYCDLSEIKKENGNG